MGSIVTRKFTYYFDPDTKTGYVKEVPDEKLACGVIFCRGLYPNPGYRRPYCNYHAAFRKRNYDGCTPVFDVAPFESKVDRELIQRIKKLVPKTYEGGYYCPVGSETKPWAYRQFVLQILNAVSNLRVLWFNLTRPYLCDKYGDWRQSAALKVAELVEDFTGIDRNPLDCSLFPRGRIVNSTIENFINTMSYSEQPTLAVCDSKGGRKDNWFTELCVPVLREKIPNLVLAQSHSQRADDFLEYLETKPKLIWAKSQGDGAMVVGTHKWGMFNE